MAEESINQLKKSIDQLKEDINFVDAKCYIVQKEVDDSPYMTELTSLSDKLNMIRSAVDALLTKISHPQTRQQRGREKKARDSGFTSVNSSVFGSRVISGIDGGNGLSSLVIEENSVSTDDLHQQCPFCFQKVLGAVQETESPQKMPSGKEAAENPGSDDENIKSCCCSLSKEEIVL